MATKSKKSKRTKGSKVMRTGAAATVPKPAAAKGEPRKAAAKVVTANASKAKLAKTKTSDRKRVSALEAAAQVLAKSGKPMRSRELIAAMTEQGLWTSPAGKTPWATLYSAMLREISTAGKDSRFKKVDRGSFAFNG